MELLTAEHATRKTEDRERVFETLYLDVFPKVARYISNRDGSFDDAKDVFQDALVIYFEKTMEPDFRLTVSAEAYLVGVAKHLWFRRAERTGKQISLPGHAENIAQPENETDANAARLLTLLERTGKKCLELLHSFYYKEQSVKDITQEGRYRSEHSVSVQKYKCLEKIRDFVKEKSIGYETFID